MIDLKAIKQRVERATAGPWKAGTDPCHFDMPEVIMGKRSVYIPTDADAAFIAHARDDIPDLLTEVERLQEESDKLEKRALFAEQQWNLYKTMLDALLNTQNTQQEGQ